MTHEGANVDHDDIIFLCDICPTDASLSFLHHAGYQFPSQEVPTPCIQPIMYWEPGPQYDAGCYLKR